MATVFPGKMSERHVKMSGRHLGTFFPARCLRDMLRCLGDMLRCLGDTLAFFPGKMFARHLEMSGRHVKMSGETC